MRINVRIGVVLLVGLLLTGCGYGTPVDNRSMVVALGIGLGPHGMYRMTTEVLDPSGGASSSGGAVGSGNPISVFTGQSKDLGSAFELMQATAPGSIDLGNVTTLLFSEALAKQSGLSAPVTYLSSFGMARLNAWTVVVRGSTQTVISTPLSTAAQTADRQIYLTQTFVSATHPDIYTMPLWALYRDLSNPEQGLVLPLVALQHRQLAYIGSALFHNGRMTGTLTPAETAVLTTVTLQRPGLRLNLILDGRPISIKVVSAQSHIQITPGPHAVLSVTASAMPLIGPSPLTQTASKQRQLETLASSHLAHEVVTLYTALQKAHCDALDLGLYLRASDPSVWAQDKARWPTGMLNLPLTVHVHVLLNTPGT